MSVRRMDEDEIQRMLTQVYRESEYKVTRHDPVIVPYIIQKNMLLDFNKEVAALFNDFTRKALPPLQAEAEKLRRHRDELMALASGTAEDIVREAGEKFNRHMQETSCAEIDAAVLRHLEKLTQGLQETEGRLVEKLERQHEAFADTANQFLNHITYLLGGASVLFLAAHIWWTWLR